MRLRHWLVVVLIVSSAAVFLSSCSRKRELSQEERKEIDNAISKAMDKGFAEVDKKIEELRWKNVTFLVDGVRDGTHRQEIFSKLQDLKDDGKNNEVGNSGGYYQNDELIRIAPISDMQATAARIDFAQVLAVDEKARVILLDASAKPAARPPDGWPGADAIKAYAIRKTISYAPRQAYEGTVKELGRDKVVVVWVPGQKGQSPDDHPTVKQLRAIAPKTLCHDWEFGPKGAHFVCATVAPAPNFGEILKAVEGSPVLAADEQRRAILIGDVNDLLPESIDESMARIQESKARTNSEHPK